MATTDSAGAQFTEMAGTPGLDVEPEDELELDFEQDLDAEAEIEDELELELETDSIEETEEDATGGRLHRMYQMGAKRIGSLAIGIAVVGIVLNEMSNMDIVTNSTGVIDVSSIFQTAGSGLNLLVVGVIIAAAAVLLNLWSGF